MKNKKDVLSVWIQRINVTLIWAFMLYLAAVGYATVIEHVFLNASS